MPVFVGHSEAVNIEFENEISADQARDILREAPGVMVVDKREDGGYVTPVEAVGDYATYVSRIREDPTVENGLSLWIVSDNLRKGAALNAVQIAELLGRKHLQKAACLGLLAPVAQQLGLDELKPGVILVAHLQPLERGDLVEVVQQVAAERVRDAALDEGDRDQPLALGHRLDLVQRVRG